jgi:sulfatase maturation enzyme AslB (radical SAM superfamily)
VAIEELKRLIAEMLKSQKIKEWFRAYFNYGLINYIEGNPRLLPCQMGHDSFFLDPDGNIFPCNVMEESMGNLTQMSFQEIWNGPAAERVRGLVRKCEKNCWMIGSVSQQMRKHISRPSRWILKHKFFKKELCL